ncbi:histidine phosphatase family protein [Glycomyces buryatensis]|uniref:Histidine phosphatase family protein n=1 Tax=Glycomyces buryatensis TaxID=2570927 RepID=A0A4S8QBG4_9ACTN|nr:histidine phosphatase family protein [Glycomyces buryatensis]
MRTVHVVTHPEATHHVESVVGGWHDSPLTPAGIRAARSIGQALRAAVPEGAEVELFSSDLQRTKQTAEVIAERVSVQPILDRRLREKSFGEAEAKPKAWLDQRYVPPPAIGNRMEHDLGVPGAESNAALAQRINEAMDEILQRPCEHQIIVTHGFALTFVVASWIKMPIESLGYVVFKVPSGSITTLHEDDFHRSRQVIRLGDTRHLDPIRTD